MSEPANIHSPFNACMYREHCKGLERAAQAGSPTAGMSIAERILHVGGRNNAAGYVEFGSVQAVEALVRQVLRDMPAQALPAKVTEEMHVAACKVLLRAHGLSGLSQRMLDAMRAAAPITNPPD